MPHWIAFWKTYPLRCKATTPLQPFMRFGCGPPVTTIRLTMPVGCNGRKSYQIDYTLKSSQYGGVKCQISGLCCYHKGERGKHGLHYVLFVSYRLKIDFHQLLAHYWDRFGIATSYRIKNQCRIRTTTKQPGMRLLFVGIAFVLVNLWNQYH